MVHLAKECRQVGGQGVNERLPLLGIRLTNQPLKVVAKTRQAVVAQTLGQTTVDHLALVFGQHDAGPLIDQLSDAGEILIGQDKVTLKVTQARPLTRLHPESSLIRQNVSHSSSAVFLLASPAPRASGSGSRGKVGG